MRHTLISYFQLILNILIYLSVFIHNRNSPQAHARFKSLMKFIEWRNRESSNISMSTDTSTRASADTTDATVDGESSSAESQKQRRNLILQLQQNRLDEEKNRRAGASRRHADYTITFNATSPAVVYDPCTSNYAECKRSLLFKYFFSFYLLFFN